ncbi:hypothetical protein E2562_016446 [Oryza meyeriana var. granulata]|uniref:Tf2-1-like SH3-like domain-containing protein n=1 Tax=Oryza meyeriana var. granulata TaxID=110450 RepID=A0A6G1EX55_9ORYZ|nr:hypothetical protein E2562_016446 [Oryza meyeriana var. granulata]
MKQGDKIDILLRKMDEANERSRANFQALKEAIEGRLPAVEKKVEDLPHTVGDLFLKVEQLQSETAERAAPGNQVLARVGSVTYKLQLPAEASIHPIFHVSQLRAATGFSKPRIPCVYHYTFWISDSQRKWSGCPAEEATWEALEDLRTRFPHALKKGGMSRS